MENQTLTAGAAVAPVELPELLTLQQASQILKVHPNTLRNWERSGLIPVVRVGPRRDRRFPRHGISQFLPGAATPAPLEPAPQTEANQVTQALEEGSSLESSVPVVTETADEATQELEAVPSSETPHVIVNVPPRQRWSVLLSVIVIALAVAGAIFYTSAFRAREVPTDTSFAIRRNPPSVLFSDDFEAYTIGDPPRTVWSSVGVWTITGNDGEKILRGEAAVDNPLHLMSHLYTGSSVWKDYQLKFDARVVSGKSTVTAVVDYLDENNYYLVSVDSERVTVTVAANGAKRELGSSLLREGSSAISDNEWHTFSINLLGDSIDVLVDGVRVIGVDDAALTTGKVGFVVEDQVVEFDHVQIVQLTGETSQN